MQAAKPQQSLTPMIQHSESLLSLEESLIGGPTVIPRVAYGIKPGMSLRPLQSALTSDPAEGSWQVGKNYIILEHKNDGGPSGIRADITMEAECNPLPSGGTAPVPVNSPWMLGMLGVGLAALGARSRSKRKE